MTLHLTLVRHGETDWNVQQRYQGSANTPLNATGESQARQLADHLTPAEYNHIYSSDLVRVQQTARLALNNSTLTVTLDERLREIGFGKFEGLTYNEIQEQFPEELLQWEADRDRNTHGGERQIDVVGRVADFLSDLRQRHVDEQVLVFGHGGTLGMLLALALGAPPRKWWQFRLANTAVSRISIYEEGAVLLRFNDTGHLAER